MGREPLVDQRLDDTLDLTVAQPGLGLALELGLRHLDADDAGQALADIVPLQVVLVLLEQVGAGGVVVDGARQRRLEAAQMGAALGGVDVVGEGIDGFAIAVVPLQGDLDIGAVLLALQVDHLGMNRRLDPVQVLDERNDPALVEELVLLVVALVLDEDAQAAVQERQLPEPLGQHVEAEVDGFEHRRIRLEGDARTPFLGGARFLERRQGLAALVGLLVHLAVALDLDLEVLRQGIDHRQPDAVQSARDLVGALVELAAGVQLGEHDLRGRQLLRGVDVDRNSAAVVDHGDAVVDVDGDLDAIALAGE